MSSGNIRDVVDDFVLIPEGHPGVGPTGIEDPELQRDDTVSASQWRLIWRRFKKHRLALISAVVLVLFYVVAIFAGFFAPFAPDNTSSTHTLHPPQGVQFSLADGGFYVHPTVGKTSIVTLERTYVPVENKIVRLGFFVKGDEYRILGVIPGDVHFFGPEDPSQRWYFLGTDGAGADLLSNIIFGSQISLSIGLVGVAISLVLGLIIGGISGYFGGWTDTIIQRIIEFILSMPTLPLWLGLAAAVPPKWGPVPTYFMITVILSAIGWTGLARVIRGKVLQTRQEDFVLAARLDGVSTSRIISRHLLPSFTSHIIATVSLAVPAMILAETSLSFLGLGLRAPAVSWGVLLENAQNVQTVVIAPWLMFPAVAVVFAVVAFNLLGDGLRDASDPYDA